LVKQLQPDVEKVIQIINQNNIKCLFIYGKDDLLFPKSAAMPVLNRLKSPNTRSTHGALAGNATIRRISAKLQPMIPSTPVPVVQDLFQQYVNLPFKAHL
jgi:hypothetical protein